MILKTIVLSHALLANVTLNKTTQMLFSITMIKLIFMKILYIKI